MKFDKGSRKTLTVTFVAVGDSVGLEVGAGNLVGLELFLGVGERVWRMLGATVRPSEGMVVGGPCTRSKVKVGKEVG